MKGDVLGVMECDNIVILRLVKGNLAQYFVKKTLKASFFWYMDGMCMECFAPTVRPLYPLIPPYTPLFLREGGHENLA